ncbi:MAG: hypothetical protein KBT49_02565 [Bacteroidetes bacterium]|nr:hypothetical protein [Candidatus Colenecus caballi]
MDAASMLSSAAIAALSSVPSNASALSMSRIMSCLLRTFAESVCEQDRHKVSNSTAAAAIACRLSNLPVIVI